MSGLYWGHCKLKLTINANQVKCWFMRRGENRSTRRKTSRCRVEYKQSQHTYDAGSGNRTRATLVEGKCSHHCAIPAALIQAFHYPPVDYSTIRPCHTAAILSRETKKPLFYHAKPRSGNHGGEAWRGKTKFFCSPWTIWPPCDKGE